MMQDVTPALMIVTIFSSLAGQTMGAIGMTFLYVWIYNNTRSVFLAIILHALTNVLPLFVLSYFEIPHLITIVVGVMPWVLVFILQMTLGKNRFPEQIAST